MKMQCIRCTFKITVYLHYVLVYTITFYCLEQQLVQIRPNKLYCIIIQCIKKMILTNVPIARSCTAPSVPQLASHLPWGDNCSLPPGS